MKEKLTHARQRLGMWEAKGHDPHVQQRLLAHLGARAEGPRTDRAICQSTLQQAFQGVHPRTLAESQARSSARVENRSHHAVATLNWARDLAGPFRRASSAVEGRNGDRSQLNHCARGAPTQRLIAADFDPAMVFFHRFHHRITRRALVEWLARNRNDRRAGDNSG